MSPTSGIHASLVTSMHKYPILVSFMRFCIQNLKKTSHNLYHLHNYNHSPITIPKQIHNASNITSIT